jgi:HSP20 family protein
MARAENLPVRRQQDNGLSFPRSADPWRPDAIFNASPRQMMRQMREDMARMFGELFPGGGAMMPWQDAGAGQGLQTWNPSIDVSENDKEYTIEVDLPGVNKDNIQVDIQNGQLAIRAEMRQETGTDTEGQQQGRQGQEGANQKQYLMRERRYGWFERTFPLPDNVDEDQIRCDFRDGVLTCHLVKSQQTARARRIPVGETEPRLESQNPQDAGNKQGGDKRKAA